jgi:hypothetical protein
MPSTDSTGAYIMTVPNGWSGTATPMKGGYSFAPANRSYSNVSSDLTGEDYTASLLTYTISGQVYFTSSTGMQTASTGLSGVVMSGLPGDPVTDESGSYSVSVDHGWTGTVTPTKTDYVFAPPSRSYSQVAADQVSQDYDASLVQYTLTIVSGSAGTTDPSPGTYAYDTGTQVAITAIPDAFYSFTGWTGDAAGTENPLILTMDSDKSITASFSVNQHNLSLSSSPGGTVDPPPGIYTYDEGTEVTLTATPEIDHRFTGWSGDLSGSENPVTITIDSDKSITANFKKQMDLTITSSSGGTTDPLPGTYAYDEGSQITITAIPDIGFGLSSWSGDAAGSDNPLILIMDSDKSVSAVFIKTLFTPLNFTGQKVINRSLTQSEYINALSWEANPDNTDVTAYRIYLVEEVQASESSESSFGKNAHILFKDLARKSTSFSLRNLNPSQNLVLLTELNANTFTFLHRKVGSSLSYTYALVAVDSEGDESSPVYLTIN